ncbi:MAG: ABC transporter permease [Verrucomicrobiota bacterium]
MTLGGSGRGKTTLLKFLGGLLKLSGHNWLVQGRMNGFAGSHKFAVVADPLPPIGGYVFQNYALFDELSLEQNLAISRDHAGRSHEAEHDPIPALLEGIDPKTKVLDNSGGQQQRIAIARTVQSGHEVLLFDEPNSGLDPSMSKRFAAAIRGICDETDRAAIISTHHYRHLLPVADRVIAFHPDRPELWKLDATEEAIEAFFEDPPPERKPGPEKVFEAESPGPVPHPKTRIKPTWQGWYFAYYFMTLLFSPTVLAYMAAGGIIAGFVSTWFLFQHFPYGGFLIPLIHDDTIESLGFIQWRILIPLITALLLAARSSAMISADLGHRVFSSQIDAMKNLNIPWRVYLGGNIVINMILSCVFYAVMNFLLCAAVCMYTWKALHELKYIDHWKAVYYDQILSAQSLLPVGTGWIAGKMALCGLAIGVVSIWFGLRPKRSVVDVNAGIAWAIIWSTLLVLLIHAGFAMLEV